MAILKSVGFVILGCLASASLAHADSLDLQASAPQAAMSVNVSTTYTINGSEGVFESKTNSGLVYYATDLNSGGKLKMKGAFDLIVYFKTLDGVHFAVDLDDSRNKLEVYFDGSTLATELATPVFLSGKLLAFGSDSVDAPQFEFLWRKDGGSAEVLASSLPFIGAIVKPNNSSDPTITIKPFSGFDQNFSYTQGVADVFMTPTPSAACGGIAIGMIALCGLAFRRGSVGIYSPKR